MKRSLCLSALLVGLSLTTATAALAAPEEAKAPKRVAQAQDPTPSNGSGSGTSSGAPTEESTPQPAVTIGTSTTPTTDTPSASAPEAPKAPAPRPFAGSSIFVSQSVTTNTIFRGQTQYDDPTTETNLYLLPRYALNKDWQLRGRMIVSYEETNSDSTTFKNEPQLSDATLSLYYNKVPTLPLDIHAKLAANVGAPTSKASQARTMIFAPGATLQLARPFENLLGGEGLILGSLTYSHPIYSSQNPVVTDDRPAGTLTCVGGNNCSDLVSGTMNPSDTLSYSLLVSMDWGKWNPALFILGANQWAYHPKDVSYNGAPVTAPTGFGPVSVRQSAYFSAWLDYNFNSWLTGEIGYWNSTNALDGAGQRSNVIFNRLSGDTRVYLGASIQIDNLVKEIQGGADGNAGIVRAKNTKQPMWTF